ncbi:SIS domain-containing protein [Georgenia deserti]|uniref:SIS domain-containing protein n=1 Tax=Georgenia deserti TaxID=2093781 RepID=A0ABW4L4K4_9MICO
MTGPAGSALGAHMEAELRSQPEVWRRAADLTGDAPLPGRGERVAIIGCGTSWFMAQAYAALRERADDGGLTDAWVASEAPLHREYDVVVALSRSGTTTEVVEAVGRVPAGTRTLAVVADPDTPLAREAGDVLAMPFADERSVVQTRFATGALTLLRASLGIDVAPSIEDCVAALDAPLPEAAVSAQQMTFLGTGWTVGLAHEAALKNREASQSWTESYPAMDYRHGPIAVAAPGRVVWSFGPAPGGLSGEVTRTGATFLGRTDIDPLADLVLAQRVALERARALGLDADSPRALTRSVILDG